MSLISSNDLSHELAVLADVFSDLAEHLTLAALQLDAPGAPPPEALAEEISGCRREFVHLRDRALTLAGSLQVAAPAADSLAGLHDLSALLDEIAEAEIR